MFYPGSSRGALSIRNNRLLENGLINSQGHASTRHTQDALGYRDEPVKNATDLRDRLTQGVQEDGACLACASWEILRPEDSLLRVSAEVGRHERLAEALAHTCARNPGFAPQYLQSESMDQTKSERVSLISYACGSNLNRSL